MTSSAVLKVGSASKSFGATAALRAVSIELHPGEMLGLLGPNGAGKTTLVRAICGRVRLDEGSIEIARGAGIGLVPQEIALYPSLTARQNLRAFGELHGLSGPDLESRIEQALAWSGLADRAGEPVRTHSGGMKRRLNVACGVLHRPAIVLLDEPTVGVDPQSRERLHEMLDALRAEGASLLLATHQLDEAEGWCDRIVILDRGAVVAEGTLAELVARTVGPARRITLRLDRPPAPLPPGFEQGGRDREIAASVTDPGVIPDLLRAVETAGCRVEDLRVRPPSLQSVFLHLTGRELRE